MFIISDPPVQPTNLTVGNLGSRSLILSWTEPLMYGTRHIEITGYVVFVREIESKTGISIASSDNQTNALIIDPLLPNMTYILTVIAVFRSRGGRKEYGLPSESITADTIAEGMTKLL